MRRARHYPRASLEGHDAKAGALATRTQLFGVEAGEPLTLQRVGNTPDECRLAHAGPAREKERLHGCQRSPPLERARLMYSSRRQERQAVRERALEGALRLLDLVRPSPARNGRS